MCRVHNSKPATEPLLPKSRTSPVGGGRMIRQTEQDLNRWLAGVRKWLLAQIEGIPTEVVGNALVANKRYEYLIGLADLRRIVAQLRARMEGEAVRQMMVNRATAAYRQGTGEAALELARLTDDYTRTVTQVLASQPYTRRAALVGARVFEQMEGFQGDRATALGRVLMDAVQRGVNPRDVARTINKTFGETRSRALRIARTEITGALRRGRLDESRDAQERLGIKTGQLWFSALSPTTRDSHAERHGQIYTVEEIEEFYSEDGNMINCFVPGTRVEGRFVAGSIAAYKGPVITLVTASGRKLTVTPNHPVMTDVGLVAAAKINKGDYALAYCGAIKPALGVADLNCDLVNPKIEDVFGSIAKVGHSFATGVRGIDFHGDARFMDKSVTVVTSDRVLTFASDAKAIQCLDQLKLIFPNAAEPHALGALFSNLKAVFLSTSFLVGKAGPMFFDFIRHLGAGNGLRFAIATPRQPFALKPPGQRNSGNSNVFGYGQDAFTRHVPSVQSLNVEHVALVEPVFRDAVVSVTSGFFDGHVYDLQEVSGLMVADGIITSNCKCSVRDVLLDDDGNPVSEALVERERAREKAFMEERKRAKEEG